MIERIPCLDGLRAFSILAVIVAHGRGTQGFPFDRAATVFGDLGNLGVRVFFVISGFLITHLLIEEWKKHGRISLKGFYIRRTFRIFPAFYTYLAVITGLTVAGLIAVIPSDLLYAGTYTINFIGQKSWQVGHLWSLAVEEQFYLLWPFAICFLGWRWSKRLAVAAVLFAPFLRIAVWYLIPDARPIITKAFPTICDTIATGCVLAIFRDVFWSAPRYRSFLSSPFFLVVPMAVLASNILASHTRPDFLIGQSVRNIGIALCIDWCLRFPTSAFGRALNWPVLVWVGTLSYSLYLWQQLFLNRNSTSPFCSFPFNVLLAFGCAILSFYLVERPFLRARKRWFSPAAGKKVMTSEALTATGADPF